MSEPYKITKPVRLIELFSGYQSQFMAMKRLKVDCVSYRTSEWDVNSVRSAHAIHCPGDTTDYSAKFSKEELVNKLYQLGISNDGKSPLAKDKISRKGESWLRQVFNDFVATKNLGSITNIHAKHLGIKDQDEFSYLLTYSFPCGLPGTKVKVEDGYKDIEDIKVRDKVLTHNNQYKSVKTKMVRVSPDYYQIKVLGYPELKLTGEHPLYILRDGKVEWIKVKDLKTTDKVCFNINKESKRINYDDKILWLLGRYTADGHINKYSYYSVNFSVAFKKEEEFLTHIPDEMLPRFKKFKKKIWDYRIADKEFQSLCKECGIGAKNKRVPQWILDAPVEQARCFLDGYLSGDGHTRTDRTHPVTMFCTTSKELFLGLQTLIAKVYGVICSCYIRRDNRKETFNDTYNCQFPVSGKSPEQERIGSQIFTPIRDISYINAETPVYNFEVEDDNSYTCENIVVHNCQDISLAGQQRGFDKGSGTRSALLWECERILRECKEEHCLPDVLLMENVKAIINKKNMPNFQKWLDVLKEIGYSSYYQVLNAKDYGIAQNRERVFCLSILGDYSYTFPEPIPLKKRLKDVLEDEVDEKYYINSEKADKLIGNLIDRGVLPRKENNTYSLSNMGSSDKNRIPNAEPSDVAHTIMARDWKGLSNYASNGVIDERERERAVVDKELTSQQEEQILEKSQTASRQSNEELSTLHNQKPESSKIIMTANMNNNIVDKTDTQVAKTLCARDYKGFGTGWDTMNGVIELK